MRAIAFLARRFEHTLADTKLSLPQYRLLAFLSSGDRAASRLAEHLTVSRPSITAIVDGLVDRGFVERRPSPDDRRKVLHCLTGAGAQALAEADTLLSARLADTVDAGADGAAVWAGFDLLAERLWPRDAVVTR